MQRHHMASHMQHHVFIYSVLGQDLRRPPRLRISHVAPLNKCIEIYIPIEALVPGSIRAGSPLQGDLNVGTYIRVHPVQ